MLRLFVSAVVALALCASAGLTQDKGQDKKKNTQVQGTIKKVDPATGTLTVSVKGKAGAAATEKEFKVDDTTKIAVFAEGQDKAKQLTGKEGLKDTQVKEGANVTITTDDTGKVLRVQVGKRPAAKKDGK